MELNEDGSMKGRTFSGENYKGGYPTPNAGETYREYRERVKKLEEQGFHLGDLSMTNYIQYCKGSGHYEGADADELIYKSNR